MKILDAVKKDFKEQPLFWLYAGFGWLFIMVTAIPGGIIWKALLAMLGIEIINHGYLIRTNHHIENIRRKLDKVIEEKDGEIHDE